MDAFRNRFSPSFQWIFALAAIVLGVAVAFATKSMSPKVTAAVYGAVVASAGFAASYTTSARLRSTVGVFFVAWQVTSSKSKARMVSLPMVVEIHFKLRKY
jgi:TRAP-type C4-dicarboxylate transport system permease small subunit